MNTSLTYYYLFLIFFGFTHLSAGTKFRCDYKYSNFANGWFKYHEIPTVWQDARLICQLEGAILASPTTSEIKASMKSFVKTVSIFTGLHATFSKGSYYSVDGVPLQEISHTWASHEPNDQQKNESCLAMNGQGLLSDVSCDEPRPYLCYRNATEDNINECGTHDPNYMLDNRTNHCYKFHTEWRTFARAHLTCSAEGGYLAIVNSEEEANVLSDFFNKYPEEDMIGTYWKGFAFIGISLWGDKGGDWRTIHGKTLAEAGYDKWNGNEPDSRSRIELCGAIGRNGLLFDAGCDKPFMFICEKNPYYPKVCDSHENEVVIPDQSVVVINNNKVINSVAYLRVMTQN